MTEMTTLGIDVFGLCKIGGLQEETEVLCRILHYALNTYEQVLVQVMMIHRGLKSD